MNRTEKKIENFLRDYNLDKSDLTYLVGFSGGYDSMCLLHILQKITQNRIVAIHLNHNWRGDESNRDEQNCADFCKKIGVELYCEKLPQNIPHTETAAREARYEFFEKCAEKFKSRVIFTAHNKNDNAETLIFRICHGTGVAGLQGIAPKRDIFYRPMLEIERKDIETYCRENNLNPNNDSSNSDNIHKRNLIRNEILPKMAEINPDVISSICSLAKIAREETEIIKNCTNISHNGKINTKEFLQMPEALQKRVLYEIITPLVPQDYDQKRIITVLDFIKENFGSKSGKTVSVTTDWWLFVSEKYIKLIQKNESQKINIKIEKVGEYAYGRNIFGICECDSFFDESDCVDGNTVFVDLSGLEFDFELRNRADGDIIRSGGTKKLKKYLNELKIPNHEKDDLIFLAQGKEILFAAGLGISDKIKVRTKPTHVIKIKGANI